VDPAPVGAGATGTTCEEVAFPLPVVVTRLTCGTVYAEVVVITVEDDGIVDPAVLVQGTVRVCTIVTVVTGSGCVGCAGLIGVPLVPTLTVNVDVAAAEDGGGAVTDDGHAVIIAGFWLT